MTKEQIDLSPNLTTSFFKDKQFKKGSVLIFTDENNRRTELKIIRLNRKSKICIVEKVRLFTEAEASLLLRVRKNAKE